MDAIKLAESIKALERERDQAVEERDALCAFAAGLLEIMPGTTFAMKEAFGRSGAFWSHPHERVQKLLNGLGLQYYKDRHERLAAALEKARGA